MRRVARPGPILALLCAAGAVALLVFGVLRAAPDRSIDQAIADGRPLPAPAYRLALLQTGTLGGAAGDRLRAATRDGRVDSARLRGVPYVVNFWASWCRECGLEAPALMRAWREQRRHGALMLGIDVQDLTGDARGFLAEHRIDFPVVRDPGGDQLRRYGVTALPETFVVDARGRVVDHIVGVATDARLRAALRSAGA